MAFNAKEYARHHKHATPTQLKAARSFDYQCRLASNCRRDKYIPSCNGCDEKPVCHIQKAIDKAKSKMY